MKKIKKVFKIKKGEHIDFVVGGDGLILDLGDFLWEHFIDEETERTNKKFKVIVEEYKMGEPISKKKLEGLSNKQLINLCKNWRSKAKLIEQEIDRRMFTNPKLFEKLMKNSVKV